MQSIQDVPDHLSVIHGAPERRSKPRVYAPFPATVLGVDASGAPFRSRTVIDNLSAGGLYLRLVQHPEPRAKLFIIIHVSNAQFDGEPVLRLQLSGEVLRAEPMPGGACGIAVAIRHNRFI